MNLKSLTNIIPIRLIEINYNIDSVKDADKFNQIMVMETGDLGRHRRVRAKLNECIDKLRDFSEKHDIITMEETDAIIKELNLISI